MRPPVRRRAAVPVDAPLNGGDLVPFEDDE